MACVIAAVIYGLVGLARHWTGQVEWYEEINLSPRVLPKYVFYSLMRAVAAYFLSLGFSLAYGYAAARSRRAERVMIPLLDILQSIPVLGFLPGLILGLVALFPRSNTGLELACILMIFTGQAWNMTFSFYSSLKQVPGDLREVSTVVGLSWLQRFKRIELPFSAIGLAWNSLMSMAGGWFFLTVCESSVLGDRKFQLPGIGSYMATAIERKDAAAMVFGVAAMCALILFVDFAIWRPVMAWVRKFQMEEIQEDVADLPFVTTLLRESYVLNGLARRIKVLSKRRLRTTPAVAEIQAGMQAALPRMRSGIAVLRQRLGVPEAAARWIAVKLAGPAAVVLCLWGATRLWELIRPLGPGDWRVIWGSVGLTFLRVFFAVSVATLWTVPAAILIGLSPRLTRFFQPLVQLAASFPAPMLYPIAIAALFRVGVGFPLGSAILILLGAQWYVLFNVLAGAMSIARDLKDTLTSIGVSRRSRWWRLYLPSIFPALVTGWITAAGGAWNASIVAEYLQYDGGTLMAPGIGSMISRATAAANYPLLGGCLAAMVLTVVVLNWTWWHWLSDLAESRFKFER